MSELEMKVEALIRCVGTEAYEKAMSEVRIAESPNPESYPSVDISTDIEDAIHAILLELGTPANIKGYPYLITGIRLAVSNPDLINTVTKGFYPKIAAVYDTTPSRVERAIRHAIEVTWDRCDSDVSIKYFGNTISSAKGKPTNSEFMAMVSTIIRRKLMIR